MKRISEEKYEITEDELIAFRYFVDGGTNLNSEFVEQRRENLLREIFRADWEWKKQKEKCQKALAQQTPSPSKNEFVVYFKKSEDSEPEDIAHFVNCSDAASYANANNAMHEYFTGFPRYFIRCPNHG